MSNASSDEAFVEIEAREVDDASVDKPLEADCGQCTHQRQHTSRVAKRAQTHCETLPTDPGQTGFECPRRLDMQCFDPLNFGHPLIEQLDRVSHAVPHVLLV